MSCLGLLFLLRFLFGSQQQFTAISAESVLPKHVFVLLVSATAQKTVRTALFTGMSDHVM